MAADRFICAVLIVLIIQMTTISPAKADGEDYLADKVVQNEAPLKERIASLDQQIMLECIRLARFNLNFHKSVNQKTFFQEWLYPMTREAGTALNFSNTVIDLCQRAKGLENPKYISRPSQKRGLEAALIGQLITGSSSAFSLGTNTVQSLQARKRGYSPARSIATVKEIDTTIESLLSEREKLVSEEPREDVRRVYAMQGRLLEHIRNQLVFEFKTWSMSSRSIEWAEDTFFAIDSAQGYTQFTSSCLSLDAFSHSHVGGAAAITNLVANSLVSVNPIVRSLAGRTAGKIQRRRLAKVFPRAQPKKIDEVLSEYGESVKLGARENASTSRTQELAFLVRHSSALDGPLNEEVHRFEKLRRIADQQNISGTLIGLTGVTRGILNTTAFYQNRTAGSTQSEYHKVIANNLNFAGRIVQSTGQVYSLILTPATEVRHFIYKRRLQRAGKEPHQIIRARLDQLDELETRIKSSQY